tara:strand:+ start:104 stop:460 length:357 start_codon:yes stop_codon:yes gene_type:complete
MINKKVILKKWKDGSVRVERIATSNQFVKEVTYYKNGHKKTEEVIKNGIRHGIYIRYWENGNKSDETHYENGKEHGASKLYNKDGIIWLRGTYIDGKQRGKWIYHRDDGEVSHEEDFG